MHGERGIRSPSAGRKENRTEQRNKRSHAETFIIGENIRPEEIIRRKGGMAQGIFDFRFSNFDWGGIVPAWLFLVFITRMIGNLKFEI